MSTSLRYSYIALSVISLLTYGICFSKEKASSCCTLGLQITDAFIRTADAIFPNMKDDGSRAYVSYVREPANVGDLEAELFDNNNGTLSSLPNKIFYESPFLFEGAALTAPAFQNLFLFDSDDATTIRLRKFDSNLTSPALATVLFPDYGGDESLEISITADGQFIALTYEQTGNLGNTFIRVIETQNLTTVASTTIAGVSNGPRWFQLKEKGRCINYFAISGTDFTNFSTLHVFKFDNGLLTEVTTAPLPQFANIPAITFGCCKEVLIATGGRASFASPNQPTVQPQSFVDARPALIPGDTNNLRIYSFAGDDLTLVYAETLPSDATRGISFHPNNTCLLVSQNSPGTSTTGSVASFRCVQPCKRSKHGQIVSADASISSSPSTIILPFFDTFCVFCYSTNGQWFLTGGSSDTGTCGDVNPGFKNINLYRVTQNCPPCKTR